MKLRIQETHNKLIINKLRRWNSSLEVESTSVGQQDSPPFMDPEGLLLYSQDAVTEPYAEPVETSQYLRTLLMICLILSSYLCLGFPSSLFISGSSI
jgi:hypothetical protein